MTKLITLSSLNTDAFDWKKIMCVFVLESNSMQLIILFSCLHIFLNVQVYAQMLESCSNSANYTSNSQFQTNLNLLLRYLRSNGSQDGFYNTSTGVGSDTVYGLVQCRGDTSMEDCKTCLNQTSVEILQRCPRGKQAALKYDDCILRYSDQRFFSQVDRNSQALYNIGNVTDIDRFDMQLGNLMNNLSNSAAMKPNRYDFGSIEYTSFSNIYGAVQCNRDLSSTGCQNCLQSMISWIPGCCNGKQGARIYSTTCDIRFETYPFVLVEPPPVSPPPPPPANTSPPQTTNNTMNTKQGDGTGKGNSRNVAAIVVPVIVSVLLLAIGALFIRRRKMKIWRKAKPEIIYEKDDIRSEDSLQFDLDTIRAATNDFSDANKLGQGGFGAVYKGELLDGQKIAVKRLSKGSGQGSQEFKNEVILLHKLQHRNLVRLLGFCLGEEEKLLIYEFVPNTSLDKYIFDPTKRSLLDWHRRYKIIGGIARGLLYLHEDSRLRIIHRDLKSGNILLDDEMNAKIADFGMAKLFGVDQTQGNTSKIAGTYGYMAPEYALHGLFSVKSDVYSFGVLILEIISGQKTNNFCRGSSPSRDLLSYTWKLWRDGNALQLMDPTLVDSYSTNEVMRCIHIGLLCVQDNLNKRPTMSSVVLMLNSYSVELETPSPPALLLETRTGGDIDGSDAESNYSIRNSSLYSPDRNFSVNTDHIYA